MEWITKIDLGEALSQKEALNVAKEIITKWCKTNNINGSIHRASAVNNRHTKARYLSISTSNRKWYVYQLIISSYCKIIRKEEIDTHTVFGTITNNIYDDKMTYYARLEKVYNLGCLDAENVEVLNEVKQNV